MDLFKDHSLTGVGWANFARRGIDYASDIAWIPGQHHSHFFLSHIAAELGVLGIAPLFTLVWERLMTVDVSMTPY